MSVAVQYTDVPKLRVISSYTARNVMHLKSTRYMHAALIMRLYNSTKYTH